MKIVGVAIDGLQVQGVAGFAVSQSTALALLASIPYEAVTVARAGNHPAFIRSQIQSKKIPFGVFLRGGTFDLRQARYDELLAVTGPGLHDLTFTTDDAVVRKLVVTTGPVLPTAWLARAVCEMTAWNPVPVLV